MCPSCFVSKASLKISNVNGTDVFSENVSFRATSSFRRHLDDASFHLIANRRKKVFFFRQLPGILAGFLLAKLYTLRVLIRSIPSSAISNLASYHRSKGAAQNSFSFSSERKAVVIGWREETDGESQGKDQRWRQITLSPSLCFFSSNFPSA